MNVFGDIPEELNEMAGKVIGAAIDVHRELGAGFGEATYQKAMEVELALRGLQFMAQEPVHMQYKGQPIGKGRIDLLVEGQLVVELKSAEHNPRRYRRQVYAYLKATSLRLGLLINFEVDVLKDGILRVINS